MVVRLLSGAVHGIDGLAVEIEVHTFGTNTNFIVSGLAGKGVRESRERIAAALSNSNYHLPGKTVVVNLAPATTEKDGTAFDLPIAVGVLLQSRQIGAVSTAGWGMIGELSLDGTVRAVNGTLGMVLALKRGGARKVVVPVANVTEAQLVDGLEVSGVHTLREAAAVLAGHASGVRSVAPPQAAVPAATLDFRDVVGHSRVKRALALAVAGGHNVLLVGPPGSGKSFLARRLPGLLPAPNREQQLEVTRIYSAVGLQREGGLVTERPFRAPHHTVSWAGLVGGGSIPKPGEITLAHQGVLFLDELPEYPRRSLEALREPLEEGSITISRSRAQITFPARFILVAAMNPCPCGYYMHPTRDCHCTAERVRRYLERISGPLLDRIDMRIEVQSTSGAALLGRKRSDPESSADLRALVTRAHEFRRRSGRTGLSCELTWAERERWALLTPSARELLVGSADELRLSTRALTRVLRLARTIADVDSAPKLADRHILEAMEFHTPRGGEGFYGLIGSL